MRGSFSDISDRKKVEEAQLEQLHLLQILIDAIPAPVFYKDPKGVYLGCNTAFETYLGLTKDQIIGKTVFEVCPEDLAKIYHEADNALFRHPGVQCYETQVLFAEGTLRDVMFYKATFSNIDGTLGGLVGTLLDITERKKAEDALRESEEKFRLFFEESRDAIFVADQDCRLINVNQSVMDMFGYSREELLGLNICETFCDPVCKNSMMEEIREKGYVREVEVKLRRKDGTTLVCLLSASQRKAENGDLLGFQGIFHDISKRKRSEEVLIRQNEYLAALNETTKGLMSRLDLDNLLTAIINRAGALMKTNHSYIYLLDQTGDRMTRQSTTGVFNDFFDFQIRKRRRSRRASLADRTFPFLSTIITPGPAGCRTPPVKCSVPWSECRLNRGTTWWGSSALPTWRRVGGSATKRSISSRDLPSWRLLRWIMPGSMRRRRRNCRNANGPRNSCASFPMRLSKVRYRS